MANPSRDRITATRVLRGIRVVGASLGLAVLSALPVSGAYAAVSKGLDGYAVLRMCQGAEQVRTLDVMCNSYLNGFIDTLAYFRRRGAKTAPSFCLGEGDKARVPTVLVVWLNAHPHAQSEPAPDVLHKVLSENFPCLHRK